LVKMLKSLLLGSAAGLVAVSAGQAADLPVKAKPVEYVKVCSLYGAGFYYMPGTDICLKIGGYVRAETTYFSNGNFAAGPVQGNDNNRITSNMVMRARAYITADAREQTAFGTARAYVAVGVATTDIGNSIVPSILGFNRAFIQWAGITAGITNSFYDFYEGFAVGYRAYIPSGGTGDTGWWVWGYTTQLGNGLSATISAEQRRATQICNLLGDTFVSGGAGAGACNPVGDVASPITANAAPLGYGGLDVPDIVSNIRVDQTWGSAQIMGAAHEVNAPYYGAGTGFGGFPTDGHPGDQWGWVAGAGLRLNFPMIAQGDYFQSQVSYTQGGLRYLNQANNGPTLGFVRGNSAAYGLMTDCVVAATTAGAGVVTGATGCNLTTGWEVNAAYEHYWTPQFHESFIFGYMNVRYSAQANDILCAQEGFGTGTGSGAIAFAGCNNNWAIWSGATRLQYDFTKSLYLGVEFIYQRYQSFESPTGSLGTVLSGEFGTASGTTAVTPLRDQNNLAVAARIHKDFLP
jgi:hypothetical protein